MSADKSERNPFLLPDFMQRTEKLFKNPLYIILYDTFLELNTREGVEKKDLIKKTFTDTLYGLLAYTKVDILMIEKGVDNSVREQVASIAAMIGREYHFNPMTWEVKCNIPNDTVNSPLGLNIGVDGEKKLIWINPIEDKVFIDGGNTVH